MRRHPPAAQLARSRLAAAWRDPTTVVIAAATVLALGLRIYELSLPGYLFGLTEYDDGSYFGSAVHLVGGVLPYRDFIFVQPPGILLLMAPVALVAKVTGTAAGMAIGRVLTMLASAAGVVLVGLLVRHRGALAALIACGVLAVFPAAIAAAHTVLVEPWLVLFCLLGAVAVFDRDRLTASGRRLAWGGAAFGFAGAIEGWALVPVLVVLAISLPWVRRALTFAAGVAAAFLIAVLPFAVLAPGRFYQSLIVAQVGHRAAVLRVPVWGRLKEMAGLSHVNLPGRADLLVTQLHLRMHSTIVFTVVILVLLTVGGLAMEIAVTRRPPPPLDGFALVTSALIVLLFLLPTQFHYHFAAFLAPFLGLAIALPAARLLTPGWESRQDGTGAGPARRGHAGLGGDRAGGGLPGGVHHLPGPRRGPAQGHHRPHRAGEHRRLRAADPARVVRRHRRGLLPHPRQPVRHRRAGLLADGGRHRHRPGPVARRDARHRGRAQPRRGRGLAAGVRPRPVRLALRLQPPPDRLVTRAAGLFRQPFRAGHVRRPGGRALPASAQRRIAGVVLGQ